MAVARVLFLLCRDFLLTKWTLRARGHLLLCCCSCFSPVLGAATPTGVETWKEDRACGQAGGGRRKVGGGGGGGGRETGTGQFCPKRAMLGAIDHAISVVRPDRMAERVDNWTPTTPEVRVMTLEGGHAKTGPRPASSLRAFTFPVYGGGHIKRNM